MMANIKPLSETVLSKVRSGFIISSLATVVEELIYNSLDAGAEKVSVSVGVNNGYVKVEDDGSGISRDGLTLLGERYATSKGHHLHEDDSSAGTFGSRGEVLCSIADISLIEIVTKIQGRPNGYRKVMQGRKCLFLSIDDKQDVGTTVVVRDLFYNQPVRRRQLQSSSKKVLHSVRECVMRIAIVHPKVAFRVVDMESEDELLRTHVSATPLSLLRSNFGIETSSLCKLSFSEGLLKLTGYVSAPSSLLSSKAIQYTYVNSRFVIKGPIHKALACLADICWDRFRGDNEGKRTQPYVGPSYCLNLACPRTSYDTNLEVSGTSVEFKDWAPVIKFIEKSVAGFWSKRKRKGESPYCKADEIRNDGMEKVDEDMSLSKKDWRLKTCGTVRKKRRTESTGTGKTSTGDPVYCMEMLVEESCSSDVWDGCLGQPKIPQTKSPEYKDPDTERQREYSLSGNSVGDNMCELNRDTSLLDTLLSGNDIDFMKRDGNYAENPPCHSGWKDVIRRDVLGVGSNEVGSGFNFECGLVNERNEDTHRRKQLLLGSPPWDNIPKTPLNCGRKSKFEIDHFEPVGRADVDSPGKDLDDFQMAHFQMVAANTWMSPKLSKNHSWKDTHMHSLPSCGGSSDNRPKHLNEIASQFSSPRFPLKSDQQSGISYQFVNVNDWDFDHLIEDNGVQRAPELRNCYGFDPSDDEKEKYFHDLSPTSSLNKTLLLECGYAGAGKDMLDLSADGRSIDDISPVTYDVMTRDSREISSPSSDVRLMDSSVGWSPSESIYTGVQMDLQRCQTLGHYDGLRGRSLTNHHCYSPDILVFDSNDDIPAETVSSSLDFVSKTNMFKLPGHCVSSASAGKDPRIGFPSCQPLATNICSSTQFGKSTLRTRRSHSAPPIYLGKRRFLSVGDCLTSATENPVLQTKPLAHSVSDRASLEHSHSSPSLCDKHRQDDKTRSTEDPHYCIERLSKVDSIISQSTSWSLDVKAGAANCDSGYLKEVEALDSSRVKWREGCSDTVLDLITNRRSVGDRLDEFKDENRILDIQSSMLPLTGDSLVPKSINRNCLESAKVLSQIDCKFIPVVARGILTVIDQHAADERIRLEEMRQKILSGELKSIAYLDEEKELMLPEIGYQLLCNYAEPIQHWGWICNIFCQDSGSFSKNLNLLNEQASHVRLLSVPCILGVKLSDTDLLEYLEQLADTDGSSAIPPSIVRVLNYKACRGAIMFGDRLLPSECSLIVEELKRTSLCFQCAHGRPTTVPLVNLKALHKGLLQLGTAQEGSKLTWHGLRRNDINRVRAKQRLDVARGC